MSVVPPTETSAGRSVSLSPGNASAVRPRPRWLRALGHDDPPAEFRADGQTFRRVTIFKHDAFAATALYTASDGSDRRVLGKFARRQSAFGLPMAWLGRWFHDREQRVFRRMADHPLVPDTLGTITVGGKPWPAAAARVFVEGKPLEPLDRPPDDFFPTLQQLIAAFHARRIAVVDLHKRDNILIDDHNQPHLMDFQISLAPPAPEEWAARRPWVWLDWRQWFLGPSQRADVYHLMKHWVRHRPDQLTADQRDLNQYRPRIVRVWRQLVRPIHAGRRRLFVGLKIRTGKGEAHTEVAPDVRPRPAPGRVPPDSAPDLPA
ncbi:MAG: hypothetical protein AAF376_10480 [Pseudomonadota bacterium]